MKKVNTVFSIIVKKHGKGGLYANHKIESNSYPDESAILMAVELCNAKYPDYIDYYTTVEVEKIFVITREEENVT